MQTVEYRHCGQRLCGSVCGVCFGLILLVGTLALLFWNEGRSVYTMHAIAEARAAAISVPCSPVSPANEAKLVHLQCALSNLDTFSEKPNLDITATGVWMERSVEMFQWKERTTEREERLSGGTTRKVTTYDYETDWSSSHISSNAFHQPGGHQNPQTWPLSGQKLWSQDIQMGGFHIPSKLAQQGAGVFSSFGFRSSQSIPLTSHNNNNIPPPGSLRPPAIITDNNTIAVGNTLYTGNPNAPIVGDMRLSWRVSTATQASVLAMQRGDSFAEWKSSYNPSYTVFLLEEGFRSLEEILEDAERHNTAVTIAIRVGGFLLLWLSLALVLGPLSVIPTIVPCVGWWVGDAVSCATCCCSSVVAAVMALTIIAAGYVFYRPFLAIPFLILVLGLPALAYYFSNRRRGRFETLRSRDIETPPGATPASSCSEDVHGALHRHPRYGPTAPVYRASPTATVPSSKLPQPSAPPTTTNNGPPMCCGQLVRSSFCMHCGRDCRSSTIGSAPTDDGSCKPSHASPPPINPYYRSDK